MDGTTRRFGHVELHFSGGATLRDIVIGMSDGLTVPFALAAGISGAIQSTGVIVTAGLAEVAAGSIAMGLGGYLAASSEAEHFDRERRRERRDISETPEVLAREATATFLGYGLSEEEAAPVVAALRRRPESWADFMMRFELGLERPRPGRALASALTIGGSYVLGGLVPLVPYMVAGQAVRGLLLSCAVTAAALAAFGYLKGRFTDMPAIRSAIQTVLIGGAAAGAAFALARAIST